MCGWEPGSEEIAAMVAADQLAWIQLCDATSTTTLELGQLRP